MLQRCGNPNHIGYPRYGGSAISVCKEWRESFIVFLQDMGERPSNDHSLDRIENRFGYFPSNCRWATLALQLENRRSPHDRPAFMHPLLIDQNDSRVAEYRVWR